MKIIIALPSRNEQRNIQSITRACDQAINHLGFSEDSIILNLDCSVDDTSILFGNVVTKASKHSISVSLGKGVAMRKAMEYMVQKKCDALVFVDTDISIFPKNLLNGLVQGVMSGGDLIVPWRKPVWNALDLTNHLCMPVIRGVFRSSIHETIGGELALSNKACRYLIKHTWPGYALNYGVDFYITSKCITALTIKEVPFDFSKGNNLRSYKSDNDHVIFGKKFYDVFLSVINCSADYLSNNDWYEPDLEIKNQPWVLDSIPLNQEMEGLAKTTADYIEQNTSTEQFCFLKSQIPSNINWVSSACSKDGINAISWIEILFMIINLVKEHGIISNELLLLIEQIFLSRTVNHYKQNIDNNEWYKSIEKQAMIGYHVANQKWRVR